jgi:hydrogenase nickel incorporation protein HypA/HybF
VHELSIASAIVQVASERCEGAPVEELVVEVGELAGVAPEALQLAFAVAAAGRACEGATLVIREVPVTVHCPACGHVGALAERMRFRCGSCGLPTGEVVGGRELQLVRLQLATRGAAACPE